MRCALTAIAVAAVCTSLPAQTLTVRLMNAKSGKPLANKNVTFQWGDHRGEAVVVVDKDGVGHVSVPTGAADFILVGGPHTGTDPHRIAYADCNGNALGQIPVAEVVAHGFASRNICSSKSVKAAPGEVVFWGEFRSSWMPEMF